MIVVAASLYPPPLRLAGITLPVSPDTPVSLGRNATDKISYTTQRQAACTGKPLACAAEKEMLNVDPETRGQRPRELDLGTPCGAEPQSRG
jgi:hypothetical protein